MSQELKDKANDYLNFYFGDYPSPGQLMKIIGDYNKLIDRQQKEIQLLESAVEEDDATKNRLLKIIDRYEELALEHHYQTILDEMELK